MFLLCEANRNRVFIVHLQKFFLNLVNLFRLEILRNKASRFFSFSNFFPWEREELNSLRPNPKKNMVYGIQSSLLMPVVADIPINAGVPGVASVPAVAGVLAVCPALCVSLSG
jgi:hypothetical protein